jgi:hypothetical protein
MKEGLIPSWAAETVVKLMWLPAIMMRILGKTIVRETFFGGGQPERA